MIPRSAKRSSTLMIWGGIDSRSNGRIAFHSTSFSGSCRVDDARSRQLRPHREFPQATRAVIHLNANHAQASGPKERRRLDPPTTVGMNSLLFRFHCGHLRWRLKNLKVPSPLIVCGPLKNSISARSGKFIRVA